MEHVVLNIGDSSLVSNVHMIKDDIGAKITSGRMSLSGYITVSATSISPKLERLYRAIVKVLEEQHKMVLRAYFGVNTCSTQILDIVKGAEEFYIPENMRVVDLPARKDEEVTSGRQLLQKFLRGNDSVKAKSVGVMRFRDFEPNIKNIRRVNEGFDMDFFFRHEMAGFRDESLAVVGDADAFARLKEAVFMEESEKRFAGQPSRMAS